MTEQWNCLTTFIENLRYRTKKSSGLTHTISAKGTPFHFITRILYAYQNTRHRTSMDIILQHPISTCCTHSTKDKQTCQQNIHYTYSKIITAQYCINFKIQGGFLLCWPVSWLSTSEWPWWCLLQDAYEFCQWISMPESW
jgi:hypothetical protein